jgi:hypothetical protein
MTYNGWSSRETWLINLWFGDSWECVHDVENTMEFVEKEFEELPTWIQDFIDIESIAWDELREHAREIEKEREEYA